MAYFLKNQNEDQNQQSGNQNQMSGGNIYSTSGSEVSSSTPTSTSSNNSSNSSQSNESGNWVNLNKYLDANQGKVGGYVDQLVKPYSDSATQFKNDFDISKQSYTQQVEDNTLSKDQASNIIKNYRLDGSSITDDEYNKVSKPLRGQFGVGDYEQTSDYDDLKKQATKLGEFGSNLLGTTYQQSLMGNNVSSGGKALNSFLLRGTEQGRNAINNKSNEFSALADFLDGQSKELTNLKNDAQEVTSNNVNEAFTEAKDGGKLIYDTFNDQTTDLLNSYGIYPKHGVNSRGLYVDYVPKTNDKITLADGTVLSLPSLSRAEKNRDAIEQAYLDERLNSLESGTGRLDSKIDNMYTFDDDSWNGVMDRSKEIENIIVNPTSQSEREIASILRKNLQPGGLWSAKQSAVQKLYANYLRGAYNSYDHPLISFRADLIKANGGF